MRINEIANAPLSRQEVFEIAKSEHANAGTLVDELPESWTEGKQGFTEFGNPYYHFGIYWDNAASWGGHPENLSIVTYGPKPKYEEDKRGNLKKVAEDPTRYCCWAS